MKRYLSIILVFIFLFINFSTSAVALDNGGTEYFSATVSDTVDFFGDNSFSNISENSIKAYYAYENGKPIYSAYTLLDNCQKQIYNAVKNAAPGTIDIVVNFSRGVFLQEYFTQEYFTVIMNAICYDLPEIFYYGGYSVSTEGYIYSDGSLKSLTYSISLDPDSTYTSTVLCDYYDDMITALKNIPVDLSNRYNFVKGVHDYLADTIYYPDLNSTDYVANAHDAYGALVEGRAVCQGYGEAFKLICDYYKIPCVCLYGTGVVSGGSGAHLWNAVQMDDGLWYYLDITWDDQDSYLFYDFFLVGSETVDTYFGAKPFSQSHIDDGNIYIPTLNYSSVAYSQINHNTLFKATYNSIENTEDKILIRSFYDTLFSNVYYNGIYVEVPTMKTGAVFSVNNAETQADEAWTLVLLGDCNGDGASDVADYTEAVNMLLSATEITTACDMAADMDCDGFLDSIDLAILERAVNGRKTDIKLT